MLDELNPETGNFRINDVRENPDYSDPRKYNQGIHVDTGETWGDFWRWWKAQCAAYDAKPKQIWRGVRK